MAEKYTEINERLKKFIEQQKVFFVGTAVSGGRINVSPKGMNTLRVLASDRIIWLNLTGSGNETAAHLLENSRMTIMMCSFVGSPMILRLYGQAEIHHPRDAKWQGFIHLFPDIPGARQIIEMKVDLVQTSCGYAVPLMDFKEERSELKRWADNKGPDGIEKYWEDKNQLSLDGKSTRILE